VCVECMWQDLQGMSEMWVVTMVDIHWPSVVFVVASALVEGLDSALRAKRLGATYAFCNQVVCGAGR